MKERRSSPIFLRDNRCDCTREPSGRVGASVSRVAEAGQLLPAVCREVENDDRATGSPPAHASRAARKAAPSWSLRSSMTISSCGGSGRARRRSSSTGSSRLSLWRGWTGSVDISGRLYGWTTAPAPRPEPDGCVSLGARPGRTSSLPPGVTQHGVMQTQAQAAARPRDTGEPWSSADTHSRQNRRSEHILAVRTPNRSLHGARGVRGSDPLRPTLEPAVPCTR